jgi:hypothetical protein
MANVFPRWSNLLPIKLAVFLVFAGIGVVCGVTYYFTGKYTRVGYMPGQPVPFDHSIHVGQLGLDCRYCHSYVEESLHSNVPVTQTCYNCHSQVKRDSPKLAPVYESIESGEAIEWVRIHQVPDYAYFNHSVHVARGVSCQSCHGQVNEMEVVYEDQPLTMGWCLSCHRGPEKHLRPADEVTNLTWEPADEDRAAFYHELAAASGKPYDELLAQAKGRYGFDDLDSPMTQKEIGSALVDVLGVTPPQSCAACHR